MLRRELTDMQWDRIKGLVPGKEADRGSTGRDNRLFVDAVLWIARAGSPVRTERHRFEPPSILPKSTSSDGTMPSQ